MSQWLICDRHGTDAGPIEADGPRDAAAKWAATHALHGERRVRVYESGTTASSEWIVEPVTTYRARPA